MTPVDALLMLIAASPLFVGYLLLADRVHKMNVFLNDLDRRLGEVRKQAQHAEIVARTRGRVVGGRSGR